MTMLPDNWTLVPITETSINFDGTPVSGRIYFEAQQTVVIDGITIVPSILFCDLQAGSIPAGFALPSTNDPEILTGAGFAYKVTENYQGGRPPYWIAVPFDAPSINLATVSPVVPPPQLVSTQGLSAYQVAVANGYVGTQAEWLASLVGPMAFGTLASWATGIAYSPGPPANYVSEGGSSYVCLIKHTSGVFADDLAAGDWGLVAQAGSLSQQAQDASTAAITAAATSTAQAGVATTQAGNAGASANAASISAAASAASVGALSTSLATPAGGAPAISYQSALTGVVYTVKQMLDRIDQMSAGNKIKIVAGVLRNIGGTWQFLIDSGHSSIGGFGVSIDSNINLRLTYNFTALKVLSLLVGVDESYGRLGMQVGASVGTTFSDINGYLPMNYTLTTNGTGAPTLVADAFIANRLTVSRSGYLMRVTHTGQVLNDAPQVTAVGSGSAPAYISAFDAISTNIMQTVISQYSYRVRYAGGIWQVAGNDPLKALDTSTFATDGKVTCTVTPVDDIYKLAQASVFGPVLFPARDVNYLTMQFFAPGASTPYKTAAANTMEMNFTYGSAKSQDNASTTLPVGTYSVHRGLIPVYWNEVLGITSYGGNANLWVIGVFEVA